MKAVIALTFLALITYSNSLPAPGDRSKGDLFAPVSMHQGNADKIVDPQAVNGMFINSKIVVIEWYSKEIKK